MFELKLWLAALVPMLGLAVATWAVSVARRDVSIVDRIWSLMLLAAGGTYAVAGQATSERALAVLSLLALWAVRLAVHITVRGWGEAEDRRYRAIRARNEPGFAWKSLYLVFGLQALLAWIVSLPLLAALNTVRPPGWIEAIGAALWLAGFAIESAADWQLVRFRALSINRGRVLDTGLWRYSRHPNYFGEFLVWWGFFVMALPAGGWWSLVSPVLMTLLLLRVSGVTLLEQDIAERRPAYRDYARNTNAFFPAPPRASSAAAVREAQR